VNFAETLVLVLAAVYGLAGLLLSILVTCIWHAGFHRRRAASGELLALRLLPPVGAAFLTLTVTLPAFLIYEPAHEAEQAGPLLAGLVIFALITLGHGIVRAWHAGAAAAALLHRCARNNRGLVIAEQPVDVIEVSDPLVAVIGAWRPRIVVARGVLAACTDEEIRQVVAHEVAHVSARDNVKLLLLLASPDALAWAPTGKALIARWRAAAEFEADARASGADRRKRVALASALIKVARLSIGTRHQFPVLSMPIASDDVEGRVRRLLAPLRPSPRTLHIQVVFAGACLIAVLAVPLYGIVQELIEVLVAFGR
jgi:Zn-dependent protease with chaperone function